MDNDLKENTELTNTKLDDCTTVVTIQWTIEDVRLALKQAGKSPSDENLKLVLENRFKKILEECSIMEGWEIIRSIINITKGLTLIPEEQKTLDTACKTEEMSLC